MTIPAKERGCHLITSDVLKHLPDLDKLKIGLVHLFLQHTSASLAISEGWDPEVRGDMEMAISTLVPESWPYTHTLEGPDDMPAHVKSAIFGCSLSIPVSDGRLCLGQWQGIYLFEHRNAGSARTVVVTAQGQAAGDTF